VSGQVRYLLDTNFVSEPLKPRPDLGVLAFLNSNDPNSAFISVLTLGELRKGVAAKRLRDPNPKAASRLAAWVDGLELSFADRILGIDTATAKLWGDWSGQRERPVVDTLLAATAVVYDLTLVTRNIRDVRGIPVKLLDPWQSSVQP
jgi:predicted nucleic acid-binding protein